MFRCLKTFLFVHSCWVILLSASVSYAQHIDIQSAAEFAEDHGGKKFIDVLQKNIDATKIFCGDKNNICDAATETCLKCSYSSTYNTPSAMVYVPPTITNYEKGKCVAKVPQNTENYKIYWPDDGFCLSETSYSVGSITSAGVVTKEDTGFIAKTTTSTAFFSQTYMDTTFKDAKGNTYQLLIEEGSSMSVAYAKENFNGCEVLPVKIYNMQGCFFCPLASVIFSSANDITVFAFAKFSSSFGKLLVVVFAIWLALTTLNNVASMTKQDAPKFIATIIRQGFKITIAFLLLSNANNLFLNFINPLLSGGIALGHGIQTTEIKEKAKAPSRYKKSSVTTPESYFNFRAKIGEQTLYEKIEIYLASLQARLSYMQAVGSSLFCVGAHTIGLKGLFKDSDDPDGVNKFKDGLRMMFLGGVMTVFGFLLTIAFGFYFLDAILQLAIVGAMLPLMIAGWPFKATAQYASTGFKMILNTFFTMFFIGFVVSVNIELVDQSLAIAEAKYHKTDLSSGEAKGLDAIALAISEQNIDKVDKATSIGFTGFLIMAFGFLFGFKFVSKANELANTMAAGGLKGGISSSIGTMGASLAKGAADKLTKPIRKAAANKFHETGGVAGMASGAVSGLAGLAGKGAEKIGWKGAANASNKVANFAGKAKNLSQKVHSIYRDPKI